MGRIAADVRAGLEDLSFVTTYHLLQIVWGKARVAVGCQDLSLHDLRHSFAGRLAQPGESMTTVRDLLGHPSLIITSRYLHMFDVGLNDIGARLPSLSGAFCEHTLEKRRVKTQTAARKRLFSKWCRWSDSNRHTVSSGGF